MIAAVVGAALWSVLVSCVFGALLFAIVALTVRTFTLDAANRHLLWTLALCTTALMPVVVFGAGVARSVQPVAAPVAHAMPATQTARAAGADEGAPHLAAAAIGGHWTLPHWQPHPDLTAALLIAGGWLAGAAIGLAGIGRGVIRVRGLKRRSSPLDAQHAAELPWLTEGHRAEREIYLRLSYEIETPVAVGFRRPTILIPTELATQGGLRAIEGLIIHEHAHLRRRDDWTNLVQRIIERVFWFNPLVWLVGRRIALEREIAADDAVVAATGKPEAYAQSLWQLAREMRMPEHTIVAPGALSTRKQISVRIEALLERRPVRAGRRIAASAAVALAAVCCGVAATAAAPKVILPEPARSNAPVAAAAPARHPAAPVSIAAPRTVAVVVPAVPSPQQPLRPQPAAVAQLPERPANGARAMPPLEHSNLVGADLQGVDWRGRTIVHTNLSGANLTGARLDGAHFIDSNLSGADLEGASLRDAVISATDVSGAAFGGARTSGLQIIGSSLSGMDLHGLDVRSLVASCAGCNLSGTDLHGADLHGLHLTGLNLSGADLGGANLAGAVLAGVNLGGADLHHADIRHASFSGCIFDGTDLSDTIRDGARFDPPPPYDGQ